MKKLFLAVLFCLLLSPVIKAQDEISVVSRNRALAVSIIPNAGINLSSFNGGDSGTKFSMRIGANAGVGVGLRFLPRNSHTPVEDGLLGLYGGVAFEMGGTQEAAANGIQMLNVGIPVLLQVYPVKNFYLEAGGEFFLNVANSPKNAVIGQTQVPNLDSHKANDVKIALGAGVRFGGFGLGARYLIGMSPFAPNLPWKCNIIQVNISYAIPLGASSNTHTSGAIVM